MIIDCRQCEAFVEAEESGSYGYLPADGKSGGRFVLLRCAKCGNPILITQDNIGNQVEGDIWDTPVRLFPADEIHANPQVPKQLQLSFQEAASCFRARAYTAAAIMCRKTLEGVCVANNIQQRGLMQSLRKLREDGQINDQLFEWADALRMAGNEAAHDVNITISSTDARDMLDFTNAILDYMFSFKQKFDQFKQRREAAT